MMIMTHHGLQENFAQVLCIDSEDLTKIIENPLLVHKIDFIMKLIDKRGKHALIARLELDEVSAFARTRSFIHKYMDELLEVFESVSWVRNGKLYTRRRKCLDKNQDSRLPETATIR